MNHRETQPLLSVTVLNYNYAQYVGKCLDSILSQDLKNIEVIIINDKSTDHSLDVIRPYLLDGRVRLIDHIDNIGFTRSLIEGSRVSRGKYLTVVSADDWVQSSTAFSQQIAPMEADPDIMFVYSSYANYYGDEGVPYIWHSYTADNVKSSSDALAHILCRLDPLHSGTIIRKSAYDQVGGYDKSYRYAIDIKMWLSLSCLGKVGYIAEPLHAYRRHNNNMSRDMSAVRQALREVLRSIDETFSNFSIAKQTELQPLRRMADRNALVAFATAEIFGGRYRRGWAGWFEALKLRPVETLFQRRTVNLILRTVFGQAGFDALRMGIGTSGKSPQ